GLLHAMRARGLAARAIKPLVSGFDLAMAAVSDPGILLDAMGEAITEEGIAGVSPWRFRAPLSPDMAAQREGRRVAYDALVAFCQDAIARSEGALFIEGVGGVMVPLDGALTVTDWIAAVGTPAILVAGTYLGTLSHTLTAIEALTKRGIVIGAI